MAWTDTWAKARTWMREKMEALGLEIETDAGGNVWGTLRGASDKTLVMGGHIDSVPNGGWLDGCLNVIAGLEVMRRIATEGMAPVTLRLVDWADEKGARFGRSLFGSSAASGTMIPDDLRFLKDKDGISLADAVAAFGVDLYNAPQAQKNCNPNAQDDKYGENTPAED